MGKLKEKKKNGRVDGNSTLIHFYHMSDYSLHSTILFYMTPGGLPCHFMASRVPPRLRHCVTTLPGTRLTRSRSRHSSIPCSRRQQRAPGTPSLSPAHHGPARSPATGDCPLLGGRACRRHLLQKPAEGPPRRSNRVGCFFFMGLQIILYFSAVSLRSAFLARDQGSAPAASVTHPGRPGGGGSPRLGSECQWFFRVRWLQPQLCLLVGGRG